MLGNRRSNMKEQMSKTKKTEKMVTIELIQGVAGLSISINDFRICGPKPLGGGKIYKKWKVPAKRFREEIEEVVGENL